MALADQNKVMVRVALNEGQQKSINPNIPYTPEEIAADAIRCGEAGATIIHFHSRHPDGRQALDDDRSGAELYRRAIDLTARTSDVMMEPTNMPHRIFPTTSVEDLPHIWALHELPPQSRPLETVNIDAFRFDHHKSAFDVHRNRLVTIDETYRRRPELSFALPPGLQAVLDIGRPPFFGVFDLVDMRLLAAYAAEGLVPQPVLVSINFFCGLMWGPTPSIEALDAFLIEWRRQPIDSEISLFVSGLPDMRTYEYFQEASLDRGISMRVGLGDQATIFPGDNAAMVEHYIKLLARRGFSPANPTDLRRRINLR